MFWIIDNALSRERAFPKLMNALQRLDVPHKVIKVIPFGGGLEPEIKPPNPCIFMGSLGMEKKYEELGWFPGIFTNEDFTYEVWSEKYKGYLLNEKAPVMDFVDVPVCDYYDDEEEYFIRPCEDGKTFAGSISTWKSFREWAVRVLELKEDYFKTITPDTKITIAPVKTINAEYRFFVVDGKVITGSRYKVGTRVIYTECTEKRIIKFAQKMVDIWAPAIAFVIDIAYTKEGLKVIEINCFNSAGFYDCDMLQLVHAVEKLDSSYIQLVNTKKEYEESLKTSGIWAEWEEPPQQPQLLARISANKDGDRLMCEALVDEDIEKKIAVTGGSKIGTVVMDTKKHLGITRSAIKLLRDISDTAERAGGSFGSLDWYKSDDGVYNFGWLGPKVCAVDPSQVELPRKVKIIEGINNNEYVLLEDDE